MGSVEYEKAAEALDVLTQAVSEGTAWHQRAVSAEGALRQLREFFDQAGGSLPIVDNALAKAQSIADKQFNR